MSAPTAAGVYEPELLDALDRRLAERPVLLVGPVGSGSREIAIELARRAPFNVILDPAVGRDDYQDLVATAVHQIASQVIAEIAQKSGVPPLDLARIEEDTPQAQQARLHLANHFGPDLADVVAMIRRQPVEGWHLERALATGALPRGSRVVVPEAHRLEPEPALWELRQIANEAPFQIMLTTRAAHVPKLAGPSGAVFGNVFIAELFPIPVARWQRALAAHDRQLLPSDLEWLLQRTRSRPRTTIGVIESWTKSTSIRTAWHRAVHANLVRADDVLRLAAAIHPYAPRLLQAIASGRPPYGAIENAPSQRVARTLARMRDLDLIEQPEPRRWEIADPLLSAAIAKLSVLATTAAAFEQVIHERHP